MDTLLAQVDAVTYTVGSSYGDDPLTVEELDGRAIIRLVDASVRAGVGRFVLLSAHRADGYPEHTEYAGDPEYPEGPGGWSVGLLLAAKSAADTHLRSQDLEWTVIRPDALTDAPATGLVRVGARVPHGAVPHGDLAAVMVTCLVNGAAARRRFELVGGASPIHEALASL